ncbi:hypothetical protein K493DRAFT_319425 [Basidiobolus meristosporus CBS 931.73]|uniref:Myb-like domain-containing protein n=1 Tax=Basidiobolus meristosporus CBS 931.73 TaxID=1314790 RepID=A0A1Y1XRY1_9FUNG|nr:hypothetical protein K493DRAFT_319425 [Basidiobolus meristosporus CBS 931.73]|eukprot:ORX88497.1 hypothetical protein K493DRAFT_319425 [Basidiobolus meristosporus CBS 931.73]
MDSFDTNNLVVSSAIGQEEIPSHFTSLSSSFNEPVGFPEHALQIGDSPEFPVNPELSQAGMPDKANFSLTPASTVEYHSPQTELPTQAPGRQEPEHPGSLKRERSENWQHTETKILLKLWEKYHDELKKYKRNSNVWDKMAQELRSSGFDRNAAQCKSRVRVLMAKYKSCFVNGVEDPDAIDSFDYFHELKRLISGEVSHPDGSHDPLAKFNSPLLRRSSSHSHQRGGTREADEEAYENHPKRGKMVEQLCYVVQYLIRRDDEEEKHLESERRLRKRKRQERLDAIADKERRRGEREQFKQAEIRKVVMVQNAMMTTLIEAIKRA